jgi:Tfp pilus assembly protein PilX
MSLKKTLADESGIVLVISLLTIALLIAAGAAAIVSVQNDLRTSGNLNAGNRAFYVAEAGVNHARRVLQSKDAAMSFDRALQASAGAIIATNPNFNGGNYKVTRLASAPNPGWIRVLSVATASKNSASELEAWFKKDGGRPPKAITTSGELRISGSPQMIGTCGGAHSNDDMQVQGNPVVQMNDGLTSSNTNHAAGLLPEGMAVTGSPSVAENRLDTADKRDAYASAYGQAPAAEMPRINPADYAPHVAKLEESGKGFLLHDDGSVTTGPGITCDANGLCGGGEAMAAPQGWSFSEGTWQVVGATAADGVFYSETKVEVSGNTGNPAAPWRATIIARDDIRISGDAHIRPYPTASLPLQNHLFVSGNDLEISGNLTANYAAGAILAHQQFKITKNPKILGFVLAGDGQPSWAGDPFADSGLGIPLSEISGNPIVDYSCQFGCLGPGCPLPLIAIVGWKQNF